MDKLKVGEMAKLDNGKEYICFGQIEENDYDYIFLISNFKPLEIRFATQVIDNGVLKIDIVTDKEIKNHLFEVFKNNIK